MACSNYITKSETFIEILPNLGNICTELRKYQDLDKPCRLLREAFLKRRQSNYFVVHADLKIIKFQCLNYFRLESGDLTLRCLPNGTWSGEIPYCVSEITEDKWSIMALIIVGCVIFSVLALFIDFLVWRRRKRKSRRDMARRKLWHKVTEMRVQRDTFSVGESSESVYSSHRSVTGSRVDPDIYILGAGRPYNRTLEPPARPTSGTIGSSTSLQHPRPSTASSASSKGSKVKRRRTSTGSEGATSGAAVAQVSVWSLLRSLMMPPTATGTDTTATRTDTTGKDTDTTATRTDTTATRTDITRSSKSDSAPSDTQSEYYSVTSSAK